MPFLTTYWKQLAGIALVLIIFGFGWYKGNAYQKRKFEAFIEQQKLLAVQQQARNELLKQNQDKVLQKSKNRYNEKLKKIKDYYEKNRNTTRNHINSVRDPNACAKPMPQVQSPAKLPTESRGNADPALVEQCAITTLQYNSLHEAWDDLCKINECE